MARKCKVCGDICEEAGDGTYLCPTCGATFCEEDFIAKPKERPAPSKPAPSTGAPSSGAGESSAPAQNVAAPVQGASASAPSGSDVFEKTINGILEISWSDGKYQYSGSGLLVTASGYALTNTHVVTGAAGNTASSVTVRIGGRSVMAKVIKLGDDKGGRGSGVDLALIKLESVPYTAITLSLTDSEKIRNGERVYVIGNSLGYGTCITEGIISDKLRNVNGRQLIMTDCAVNHGNSGGPMFNSLGNVIGVIVSGIDKAEGMNFAIPTRTVMQFVKSCGCNVDVQKDF